MINHIQGTNSKIPNAEICLGVFFAGIHIAVGDANSVIYFARSMLYIMYIFPPFLQPISCALFSLS